MDSIAYDSQLKDVWNNLRNNEPIHEEQVWELCRAFESEGLLKSNSTFIGTRKIGPFYIAYTDLHSSDILNFFSTVLMPALIAINANLDYKDIYLIYLLPAAKLCAKFANSIFLIKDPLEWELLLYIKNCNKNSQYPSLDDILHDSVLGQYDIIKVYEAFRNLQSKTSPFDNRITLITKNRDGSLECNI